MRPLFTTRQKPMKPADSKRIEDLIRRLTDRSRHKWAARIYGSWMARPRNSDSDEASPTALEWHRCGRLQHRAGNVGEAIDAFRKSVLLTMQAGGRPAFLLHAALRQLADSLDIAGEKKSAAQTRTLLQRLAATERVDDQPMKTLLPADVITSAVSRCTFIMCIEWETSTNIAQCLIEQDGMVVFCERLRLEGNSDTWFEFEIQAPAGPDPSNPHVAVGITLPWQFSTPQAKQAALEIVNDMNLDNAAISACLEPDTGQMAIRGRIAFAGFHQGTGSLSDFATAQDEVTINLICQIISTASSWQARAGDLFGRLGDTQLPGAAASQAQIKS